MGESPGLSIEEHARLHARYHPVISYQVLRLARECPSFRGLFRSTRDAALFVAAILKAKVLISGKKTLKSGRRAPGKRRNACIEFHRHFPRRFVSMFDGDVAAARQFLRSSVALSKTRIARRDALNQGKDPMPKIAATPCYMLANRATWASGVLNKPGRRAGNTFDLTTIEGFAYLMHEIYHTMQWYRSPTGLLAAYVAGIVHSLARSDGHIPWAHELIAFEVEAIVFHERLWFLLDAWEGTRAFLDAFRLYQ